MLIEPLPYMIIGVILGAILGGLWWAIGGFFLGYPVSVVVWRLNEKFQEEKYSKKIEISIFCFGWNLEPIPEF